MFGDWGLLCGCVDFYEVSAQNVKTEMMRVGDETHCRSCCKEPCHYVAQYLQPWVVSS